MVYRIVTIAIVSLALAACEAAHEPPDPGLLGNPSFAETADGKRIAPPWQSTVHGGTPSFHFRGQNGVLTIEKYGPEPWGQLVQTVPVENLRGRTVEFSADLAGDLAEGAMKNNPWAERTGIGALVRGYPDRNRTPMAGKKILVDKLTRIERPAAGSDWRRYALRFDVPEGATDVQIAIYMTRKGVLKARHPRLATLE